MIVLGVPISAQRVEWFKGTTFQQTCSLCLTKTNAVSSDLQGLQGMFNNYLEGGEGRRGGISGGLIVLELKKKKHLTSAPGDTKHYSTL